MPNWSYSGGDSVRGDAPQRRIEVLAATTSGVCNFPCPVDDYHVRCGRHLVRPDTRALVIKQRAKWRLVLFQVAPNLSRCLVHRDVDADELNGRPVRCLSPANSRQEL